MDIQAYKNAKEALKAKDYKAAERAFRLALDSIDERHGQYNSVFSFYGLAQVLNADENGLLSCRDAASTEVFEGEVFLNLACAEWHSGNRRRAIAAIRHGVKIDADSPQLNRVCAQLDCRKKCCFSFLPRSHKLNRLVGRLLRRPAPVLTVHHLLY